MNGGRQRVHVFPLYERMALCKNKSIVSGRASYAVTRGEMV